MKQKFGLQQKLSQRISPQQIQYIKILQIPTVLMRQRIQEEIEENPLLEEGFGGNSEGESYEEPDQTSAEEREKEEERAIEDALYSGGNVKTSMPNQRGDEPDYEAPIRQEKSLLEKLLEQLHLLNLDETELIIGEQIVGNIEDDGYLRSRGTMDAVKSIANHLYFHQNLKVSEEEVEAVLKRVQQFDPPGVGARDLRECLLLQLERKSPTPEVELARRMLEKYYDAFTKKHFKKLASRLEVSDDQLEEAYNVIKHLNPKPGESESILRQEYVVPDFNLVVENGEIKVTLNGRNAPDLRINKSYRQMYEKYKRKYKKGHDPEDKKTYDFIKKRIEAAKWFIEAIHQRQHTLLYTMEAIAEKQKDFFLSGGDEKKLRPMILKDIADEIEMDISTVSRVANSKYVQTEFGIYRLKHFFSEAIETDDGTVSNREVKEILKELIGKEDKRRPLSDDHLAKLLKEKGYRIARRTVAKYREQLNIPVSRLRKEF